MGYLKFYCLFSFRTLMVSWLIFKSFIHLEFIFVYGIRWWLSFMFLHVAVQISQHHLLERLLLFHFMPALFAWVYFWALYSVPLIYVSVLMQDKTGVFWLQWPCNTVWFRYCDPSYFVLLSQNCCSYAGSFMVPYKFIEQCLFYICEICHGYFNRDCIETINRLG